MIPVPTAIEIVLTNIAEAFLVDADGTCEEFTEVLPVFSDPSCSKESPSPHIIGRRAAEKIVAPLPGYPPFNASIMDGYAVCTNSALVENERPEDAISFRVVGSVYAGPYQSISHRDDDDEREPVSTTAIYVTTGGLVPFPYDCVIPVEDVILSENDLNQRHITVTTKNIQSMRWIRPVGCDIPPNTVLVEEGDVLSCVDLGVLVTFGITHIRVQKEPKVGVLSTGNELNVPSSTTDTCNQHSKEPQFPPKEGLVYDVNRPVLLSLLATESHIRAIDYGIALDDIDLLERKVRNALDECDVLITSGGISTGEKDLLQNLFTETIGARLHFGRLNMKPGKPTTFFTWKNPERQKSQTKFIFALPGNPVSAFVCFHLLVSPALNLLQSPIRHQNKHHVSGIQDKNTPSLVDTLVQNSVVHTEVTVAISQKLSLDEERPEYHRVILSWDASNSTFVATSTGVQRSSRFLSLKGADGLLVLPQGIPGRKMWCYPGEKHLCLLLNGQNYSWNSNRGIKWKDSMHKAAFDTTPSLQHQESAQKPISVPVEIFCVGVSSDASFIEKTIVKSLSSKESRNNYEIRQPRLFSSSKHFLEYLSSFSDETDASNLRLWIIASDCKFQEQVKFSSSLRSLLERRADAMAMVARRKMAEECSLLALFEVVVGWYKRKLIVCLPQSGIGNPIRSLEPLIAHALLLNISA